MYITEKVPGTGGTGGGVHMKRWVVKERAQVQTIFSETHQFVHQGRRTAAFPTYWLTPLCCKPGYWVW